MPPKSLRAILGGTHKVRKSQVSPGPSPRRRNLSSSSHRASRLSNYGRPLSTSHTPGQEQPTTVLAAIAAVRESMFTPLSLESHAARTMPSTQIARVLAFQRRAAPIVNTSHVRRVLPDATAATRQIAEALAAGTVRRIIVTRSRRWEGLVCLADLEALVRGEQLLGDKTTPPVTEDTANAFLAWVRSGDTCGGLTRSQEDELVRAGFLAAPTIREWTRHSETASWNPLAPTTVARAPVGSRAAVGGDDGLGLIPSGRASACLSDASLRMTLAVPGQGVLLGVVGAAVGALVEMVARRPWREAVVADVRDQWDGATPGAEQKKRRGEKVASEGTARKWREFYGLRFEWVLDEAVAEGMLEVFETGSVGRGVRTLG